jgi:hypothetical protein
MLPPTPNINKTNPPLFYTMGNGASTVGEEYIGREEAILLAGEYWSGPLNLEFDRLKREDGQVRVSQIKEFIKLHHKNSVAKKLKSDCFPLAHETSTTTSTNFGGGSRMMKEDLMDKAVQKLMLFIAGTPSLSSLSDITSELQMAAMSEEEIEAKQTKRRNIARKEAEKNMASFKKLTLQHQQFAIHDGDINYYSPQNQVRVREKYINTI